MGLPKSVLDTIQSISVLQNPLNPHGEPFPLQNHLFSGPIFWLKKVPGPAGTLWGPNLGYWVAKMSLGVEHIKVAH